MASVSPLRFVLKASLLWVALSVPFVVLYLVFDPMRVLRWHDDMMPGGVVSNKGNITALQYLHNRDSIRYDSFVVGSSLSINFLIDDWLRFLPDGAAAYHFDSSAMDLEQLELSLKFLAENAGVRNLMIVWDTKWDVGPSVFPAPRRALPFVTAPVIAPDGFQAAVSHWSLFSGWYSRAYLNGWVCELVGARPKGHTIYPKYQGIHYDPITNEETAPAKNDSLAALSDSFMLAHPRLAGLKVPCLPMAPALTPSAKQTLARIAGVLGRMGADYRFVVVPNRKSMIPAAADDAFLRDLFGERYVLCQPALGYLTLNPYHYFDDYHFRPEMACKIMEYVHSE